MSSHYQLHSRLYCDKAIQTECSLPVTEADSMQSSCTVLSSGIADQAINELLSRSGNAYMRPKLSGMPIPSRSGSSVNGKTWLPYGHPSFDTPGRQRRVVSHPDSVSHENKPLVTNSGRLRVVSLPEPISLESDVSAATHRYEGLEGQSPHRRDYPSDIPQTPSPPPSPDSIVIVGSESHVPNSFFQTRIDENGWTTWANSPPRPIPALHGPSSLPYARCPSGAEGTVVEGDDLATKVWGLGSDEGTRLRSKSPQPLRSPSDPDRGPSSLGVDYQRVTSSALARHRDAVIDLAKPSRFYGYPEAYDSAGFRPVPRASMTISCDETIPTNQAMKTFQVSGHSRQNDPNFVPLDAEFGDVDSARTARDIAALRQQYISDLTPSTTASSFWSPVFQSVPTIVLGDYNPRIYSPRTDFDTYSNKISKERMSTQDTQQTIEPFYGLPNAVYVNHATDAPSVPYPIIFQKKFENHAKGIDNPFPYQRNL